MSCTPSNLSEKKSSVFLRGVWALRILAMSEFRTHADPKDWDDYVDFEVDEVAEEGTAALLDQSEHLFQLRIRLRDSKLRRQGDARRPEIEGNPLRSGQPRPHGREGVVTPISSKIRIACSTH